MLSALHSVNAFLSGSLRGLWTLAAGASPAPFPRHMQGLFSAHRPASGASRALRSMHEQLEQIRDPLAAAEAGLEQPQLAKCKAMMDSLTLSELGLTDFYTDWRASPHREPFCMSVHSSPRYDMLLFFIPAGGSLPLHDHPRMCVLSKVVAGEMHLRAFSRLSPPETHRFALTTDCVLDASSETVHLTPSQDNFHEFSAQSHCIVFDILMPPYDEEQDRTCAYYKAVRCEDAPAHGHACYELQPTSPPEDIPFLVPYVGRGVDDSEGV